MKKQAGFTLIELIVVIVILGILAATALPRFIDFRADAEQAAIAGVAGGLSSAASINYAGCSTTNNVVTANRCVQVNSCADVGLLLAPALTLTTTASNTAYSITADTAITNNADTVTCTLNKGVAPQPVYTTTFAAIGAAI